MATSSKTSRKQKTTLDNMRKINNGFLKHEGLELPEEDLKRLVSVLNDDISKEEWLAELNSKYGA
ncbi:hypothetical protein [Microcoleus sp. herbarium8]|uniref:hypothetical protein n=1 Tax=Microcoleus sp. herbarium8 TaxID=3055436 RepID=UPI002FD68B70